MNCILRSVGMEVTVSLGGVSEGCVGDHGVKASWTHVKSHCGYHTYTGSYQDDE